MRTILLLAAAAPLAFAAAPAAAQSTGTVTIDGTVASRCLFTTDSKVIHLGEMALPGSSTDAGRLDSARVDGKTETLVGWCNDAAAEMSVEASPLVNTAPAAANFTNRVDFTATAAANGASANDTTLVDGLGTAKPVGMFSGNVVVTLSDSSAPSNQLLVAGNYDGWVKVTLSPIATTAP